MRLHGASERDRDGKSADIFSQFSAARHYMGNFLRSGIADLLLFAVANQFGLFVQGDVRALRSFQCAHIEKFPHGCHHLCLEKTDGLRLRRSRSCGHSSGFQRDGLRPAVRLCRFFAAGHQLLRHVLMHDPDADRRRVCRLSGALPRAQGARLVGIAQSPPFGRFPQSADLQARPFLAAGIWRPGRRRDHRRSCRRIHVPVRSQPDRGRCPQGRCKQDIHRLDARSPQAFASSDPPRMARAFPDQPPHAPDPPQQGRASLGQEFRNQPVDLRLDVRNRISARKRGEGDIRYFRLQRRFVAEIQYDQGRLSGPRPEEPGRRSSRTQPRRHRQARGQAGYADCRHRQAEGAEPRLEAVGAVPSPIGTRSASATSNTGSTGMGAGNNRDRP